MIKRNKWTLILGSLVILLPIAAGLLLWQTLPDRVATHWGADGQPDGWSGKAFAVFGLPLFILALHWLCVLFTARDPRNKDQNPKPMGIVLWICPVLSVLCSALVYATALEVELPVTALLSLGMGLLFAVIGNYLPKCKPNHTIGIRIAWTLNSQENWTATHRVGGRVWLTGGIVMMASAFLPVPSQAVVMAAVTVLMAVLPVGYSWAFHKKECK